MTGVHDYATDGHAVIKISNGDPLLGDITGSGCMVGTAVATFCGAVSMARGAEAGELGLPLSELKGTLYGGDMLLAAVGAVLAVTVASEYAAARPDCKGPGTFLPALIDELAALTPSKVMQKAKLEVVE
jgi:thiamine-phosphate diphosphorylase/hydroxyethylthiazole kinase